MNYKIKKVEDNFFILPFLMSTTFHFETQTAFIKLE